jgi:hypothetical protein
MHKSTSERGGKERWIEIRQVRGREMEADGFYNPMVEGTICGT